MTRPKKFPTILLCFTLVLALLVSGITKPGFLLPLFRPVTAEPKDTAVTFETPPPGGSSRAFVINPEDGVTLYAEENALDTDRTFNVSRMTRDAVDSLKDMIFRSNEPDLRVIPMLGWNVDAGMEPDELLPGVFHFDVDLDKIGIPEFLFQALKTYHIDSDGMWTEMAAEVDGSTLKIESRHNDAFAVCAAIVMIPTMIGGLNTALSSLDDDFKKTVNNSYRLLTLTGELPVYEETVLVKSGVNTFGENILLYSNKGRKVYTLKYRRSDEIAEKMTRLKKIEERLFEACHTTAVDLCKRKYGDNYTSVQLTAVKLDLTCKACVEDPEYISLNSVIFTSFNLMGGTPHIGEKMTELCLTARKYLKNIAKIKVPTYVVTIYMDPEFRQSGVTVPELPLLTRSYLRVNTGGLLTDDKKTDEILLTLTHELAHVSQREYCHTSFSNVKFDEATAQLLEETAYKWYREQSPRLITTDHDLGNGKDYQYLAVEMDGFISKTWEASDSDSMTVKDFEDEGERSNTGYIYARFFEFLWKAHGGSPDGEGTYITWDQLFRTYSKFWTTPTLSELIMKAFGLETKSQLDSHFLHFAYKIKTQLYAMAFGSSEMYAFPTVGKSTANGCRTRISNQDLTIKLRRFIPTMPPTRNVSAQISLVLVQEPGFRQETIDTKFIQVGITNGEMCKYGLFYPPNTYKKFTESGMLEVDGWTAPKTEGAVPGEYRIWTLFAPEKITPEVKDKRLRFKMPEKSDAAKASIIDGYRVTVTPSRGGPAKAFYWMPGVAGSYVTLDFNDVLSEDFLKSIRSGDENDENITFRVSVCEYIEDGDLTKHFGPESETDSINALLSEMGAHEGKVTITLHWPGHDDLDLHCITPDGSHISYNNKSGGGGYLDVDMNINGERDESIEHIYFDQPKPGEYSVYIDNYKDRTEGSVTADIIISVEHDELLRDTASMGGKSKTWKFRIEEKAGPREGGEYYIGSVLAPDTGSADPE